MSTAIILIRHGETDWNAQGRIQGHLPVPLNARGLAQAQAVADRLREIDYQAIYSSDLPRARQTAEAIAHMVGHEVRLDTRLREWDLGILAGLAVSDAERRHPRAFRTYRERIVDRAIPGGESIRRRYERVTDAVQDIAADHPGRTVVAVSHGGPLGDCYRRAMGAGAEARLQIDLFNAAINRIRIDGARWTLEGWADIDHLGSIGSLANWEGRHRTGGP